jgi:RIP metalloprotease RseP
VSMEPRVPDATSTSGRSAPGAPAADSHVPPTPDVPVGGRDRRDLRETPLPLLVFAALLVYLGVSVSWWVVAAVLGIALMIFLHELGHYVAARRGGMKVTEFFLGFGPRLWSFTRGETTYGLKAIPLGAYVRIIGMSNLEEVPPEDEARTYRQASYPRRLAVAVAGSTMHFVQAFLLLMVVYAGLGVSTDEWRVRDLTAGSPADRAGLQVGDRVVSIGGQAVDEFSSLATVLKTQAGADTEVVVERDGAQITTSVVIAERFNDRIEAAIPGLESGDRLVRVNNVDTASYAGLASLVRVGDTATFEVVRRENLCTVEARVAELPPAGEVTRGFLGVAPQYETERVDPVGAAGRSIGDFGRVTSAAIGGIARFFKPSNIGGFVSDTVKAPAVDDATCRSLSDEENRVLSIYGFGKVASEAGRDGVGDFLELFALFNIFIGVFNLLPTLPFDGGHVVVATYERIRSRKGRRYFVNMEKLLPITYAVAGIMVFLGVLALFRDIIQPPSLGG